MVARKGRPKKAKGCLRKEVERAELARTSGGLSLEGRWTIWDKDRSVARLTAAVDHHGRRRPPQEDADGAPYRDSAQSFWGAEEERMVRELDAYYSTPSHSLAKRARAAREKPSGPHPVRTSALLPAK